MNNFLKTRAEVQACTKCIKEYGLIPHGLSCKDYDIWGIAPLLKDGNILDLGSSGSYILENAVALKLKGRKVGVDLAYEHNNITESGIELFKEDLMQTHFEDEEFHYVCCLSVIEHEVDYDKLAKECARLLKKGGHLFMTFDYWSEKIDTDGLLLYGLKWNILDRSDVTMLIEALKENGLFISGEIDWTTQDKVINDTYCAPFPKIAYTFGLFEFIKQ